MFRFGKVRSGSEVEQAFDQVFAAMEKRMTDVFGGLADQPTFTGHPSREGDVVPQVGPQTIAQDAEERGRQKERLEWLKKEWPAKVQAAIDALEKPPSPYRIRKDPAGGFVVEQWRAEHTATYVSPYAIRAVFGEPRPNEPKWEIEFLKGGPKAWIEWGRLGNTSHNFYADAELWLRQFLGKPEVTYYDDQGEPLP